MGRENVRIARISQLTHRRTHS